MFVKSKRLRETGDTIVEVLIALTVISVVLAGAYVTTNRSLTATRSAQERSSALKLVESQIEQLRGLAQTDPPAIFGGATPVPFCVSGSGAVVAASDAACKVNAGGVPTTAEPVYALSIARASDGVTFTVNCQWTSASGRTTDNVQITYRVYEDE